LLSKLAGQRRNISDEIYGSHFLSDVHQATPAELDAAVDKLPDSNARVQHLINSIAVAELRALVTELEAAEEVAYELRSKIVSLQLSGSSTPNDIISRAFAQPPALKPSSEAQAAWAVFLKKLATDPSATLDT